MGYSKAAKGYRLYDLKTKVIFDHRDVSFNEDEFGNFNKLSLEEEISEVPNLVEVDLIQAEEGHTLEGVEEEEVMVEDQTQSEDEQEEQPRRQLRRSNRVRQPPERYGSPVCHVVCRACLKPPGPGPPAAGEKSKPADAPSKKEVAALKKVGEKTLVKAPPPKLDELSKKEAPPSKKPEKSKHSQKESQRSQQQSTSKRARTERSVKKKGRRSGQVKSIKEEG